MKFTAINNKKNTHRHHAPAFNTMKNTAPPRALRGQGLTGAAPPMPPVKLKDPTTIKGGGWACAFRRKGMPLHALAGRGLPMCDLQGAHGKQGEGYSPRKFARSTANKVTLKQGCGYSPARR